MSGYMDVYMMCVSVTLFCRLLGIGGEIDRQERGRETKRERENEKDRERQTQREKREGRERWSEGERDKERKR